MADNHNLELIQSIEQLLNVTIPDPVFDEIMEYLNEQDATRDPMILIQLFNL